MDFGVKMSIYWAELGWLAQQLYLIRHRVMFNGGEEGFVTYALQYCDFAYASLLGSWI